MATGLRDVDVPTVDDREVVLYCLREAPDVELSATVIPSLFSHFETLNLWSTACDASLTSNPADHFRRKLMLITAMSDDASAFLSKGVQSAVCETDDHAQAIGRVATTCRWVVKTCSNLALLATMDDAPGQRATGAHDVHERYSGLAKKAQYYLGDAARYTYNPGVGRNVLNPEHIEGLRGALEDIEAEHARLVSIEGIISHSESDGRAAPGFAAAGDGAAIDGPPVLPQGQPCAPGHNAGSSPSSTDPRFFSPPLSHFVMLRDIAEWAYSLACRDFHARLLHNQRVVFAGLKARLAQVKRAVPSMKTVFSEEQRRDVFDALDQLHYDASQFLRHLSAEASKVERLTRAPQRPSAAAPVAERPVGAVGSFINLITCRPEVPSTPESPPAQAPRSSTAAGGTSSTATAQTAQLVVMTRQLVDDTTALRKHMDRAFADEYASGVTVRATRAASKMLQWAQSATVVFGPPTQQKAIANPENAA